ncbi:dormancy-associated protein homolog 4 [Punica granatum]|uniref:Uncharacterized protein n=2 Tax=Punica granatum TaxID=22663 RepID=A0A2I0KMB0_PUNGR|nr:dormancy-associated protein homolog 4 [Punica granatum]PKI69631.1 hypothetical protein CRG98_009986 [Punica granatum]
MGFLHKLWDETLAGPTPDSGLGKLRKYDSFSATQSAPLAHAPANITRSITLMKNNNSSSSSPRFVRNLSVETTGSVLESPVGPSTPGTPVSPMTPPGDFKKFTRRKASTEPSECADPRSPTVYDWIVISALDR